MLATALAGLGACAGAAPTEAVVRPAGSPVSLTVPVEYDQLEARVGEAAGFELARPGATPGGDQPSGRFLHRRLQPELVEQIARRDLRLVTAEGLDPLEVGRQDPERMRVLDYLPISEDDWWGSRMRLLVAAEGTEGVVFDRLVLVGRAEGDLIEVEFSCSAGCFGTFGAEIEAILDSWTTEEQP